MPLKRGYIHVYTGNGKGKTTSALGLCLRAIGRGLTCCFIQFLKGKPTGELTAVKNLPGFKIVQTGRRDYDFTVTEADRILARKAVELARQALREFDVVVLDEVNVALHLGLISLEDVLALIEEKPEDVELVLTGRHAKPEVIRRAHYVTEFRLVKHPFYRGEEARNGIDR